MHTAQQFFLLLVQRLLSNRGNTLPQQLPRKLGRIRDRGRAEDEHRIGTVEAADALQSPEHVRHV